MLYSVNSPILRGCLVMAHISGEDRSQVLLLPDAVEDYVGADNPVRFIDAFVDSLDLEASGFGRVRPRETSRPGYDPADLLKLYIYGYLNRVRSSRRLEAETHRNLEVVWLLRRLRPDFKTVADFRRDNRHAFREVFREFVRMCRELDLYGCELIAVDVTCIKAVRTARFLGSRLMFRSRIGAKPGAVVNFRSRRSGTMPKRMLMPVPRAHVWFRYGAPASAKHGAERT